jgi:hypothetical protein
MSRVFVASTPAVAAGRMIHRCLATFRGVRAIVESSTHATDVRAVHDTRLVQPGAGVSFITVGSEDDAGRLDATAGCEFVDDRIRLRG